MPRKRTRRTRQYNSIKHYFRTAHPEYNWTFTIASLAERYWGYAKADAQTHQQRIVEVAFKNAKRRDALEGISVVINAPSQHR